MISQNSKINNSLAYGTIHRKILQSKQLSWKGKLVYALLMTYAGANNKCWPSITTITNDLGIGKMSVLRALKELEEFGIIQSIKFSGKHNEYYIDTSTPQAPVPQRDYTSTPRVPVPVPQRDYTSTPQVPEEEHNNKQLQLTGIITDYTFDFFWNEYHLKTNNPKTDKEPAKKIWDRLTATEKKKACDNIEKYTISTDPKFRKKARTFLKDKNFNDEFRKLNDEYHGNKKLSLATADQHSRERFGS